MKRILWSMALGLSTLCAAAQRTVDVVLIGGQSNSTGQGVVANLPSRFAPDTAVRIFHSSYLKSGRAPRTWLPLCAAAESPDRFGPELGLGNKLRQLEPNRQWALVKHGLSGSNLHTQWNPTTGAEYRKFIETVQAALGSLRSQGFEPVVRAMVWQQGEADARFDAGEQNTAAYAANLKNFIAAVRCDLDAPKLVFVVGQVMPLAAERFTGRDAVRAAQKQVVEQTARTRWVACDDLQMRSTDYRSPAPEDDVHFGTFGQLTLGERYAEAVVEALNKY